MQEEPSLGSIIGLVLIAAVVGPYCWLRYRLNKRAERVGFSPWSRILKDPDALTFKGGPK